MSLMKTYSVWDKKTGLFTGQIFECLERHMTQNVPAGCSTEEGKFDHLSQRMEKGELVDYVPDRPSDRHEWNEETKRWVYVPTELEACQRSRMFEYPTMAELADAIYHKELGDDSKMHDYLEKCIKVKEKFPKPK